MTRELTERIRALVTALDPLDDLEAAHRAEALRWLASTSDLFRRQSRPVEPRQHLVSYFLLVDSAARLVLLGDHLKSGLWLPSGGHVEPEDIRAADPARFDPHMVRMLDKIDSTAGWGALTLTDSKTVEEPH